MTNAEKYLKDEVNIDELTFKFDDWHFKNSDVIGYGEALFRFLQEQAKPTLTEDERVILRNLKQFNVIGRGADFIYVSLTESPTYKSERTYIPFADLFQFIKPRRRI